jgi:hypothetical protein
MSWIGCGRASRRCGRWRLTVAGSREAQAPATRARRAGGCPALVSGPCRRRAPLEDFAGVSPRSRMSGLGCSTGVRAPPAATRVTAPVHGTPRQVCSASTTGFPRQDVTWSWRAGARRGRRAGCSFTARTAACETMGCAGVGPTTALRQRRWAGLQVARPVERLACRSTTACRRNFAAWRSRMGAARARPRWRMASSATVGTATGVRSPARIRRAHGGASRQSVCTRAPAVVGISEGATTPQTSPVCVRSRYRQYPQGPASETQTRGLACDGHFRRSWSRSHWRVPRVPNKRTSAA